MKIYATITIAVLAFSFAGCTEKPTLEAGLITPGHWQVSGDTDHLLFWAHNNGAASQEVAWNITLADGTWPANWTLELSQTDATLSPDGTKTGPSGRPSYPDWTWTLATLTVPEDEPAGVHKAIAQVGSAAVKFDLVIDEERGPTSGPDDEVTVQYRGTFSSTGKEFDSGEFPTRLGSGQTVAGFDNGLMGLAVGESAKLVLPPALGYGYDATGRLAEFSGQSLTFEVTLLEIS